LGLTFGLLSAAMAPPARAFPGVLVGKDEAERSLRASSIVLLQYQGISVVTLSAEYQGPLTPFAFVVPVPADVRASGVKTVRRSLLSRVEAVSAPRFHAFYEQDPCDDRPVEQVWDEHVKVHEAGFLASPGLPPLDRHYAVSNDIDLPVTAAFKERESEFRYRDLTYSNADKLRAALAGAGYRIGDAALALFARELHAGDKLLLVEVELEHVELSADNRVQLGGMRYVTHEPLTKIEEALGAANGHAPEEVFVYVLDRASRYELKNGENVRPPVAVRVEPRLAEHVSAAYNGLFDAVASRHPDAYVTEFAWSTQGCGEPCQDVPLGPDELLTLGGDVLEAQTTTASERAPEPADEVPLERERFERRLDALAPKERPAALREHAAERREIARRRAISARQTYVLTRLHHRYGAGVARRDLELVAAPPLAGGSGVPVGARGELPQTDRAASENRLQMRFYALEHWVDRGKSCSSPQRFRWGTSPSPVRMPRAVPFALDLAGASRDPKVLGASLLVSFPELGLSATAAAEEPVAPVPSAPPAASAAKHRGCALGASPGERGPSAFLLFVAAASFMFRKQRRPARVEPKLGGPSMTPAEIRALQAPLKERYRSEPDAALVTLSARGELGPNVTCEVESFLGPVRAGLHPATGGDGTAACSGDMLLQALVACAGVTLNAVATALGIALRRAIVRADGELDFRGTLGVARDAPVGFRRITLVYELDTDASDEQLANLLKLAERYCVVFQTLKQPPELRVVRASG
jgi:uncharacterized OsmC-like protein